MRADGLVIYARVAGYVYTGGLVTYARVGRLHVRGRVGYICAGGLLAGCVNFRKFLQISPPPEWVDP